MGIFRSQKISPAHRFRHIGLILFLAMSVCTLRAQPASGTLCIVGGGEISDSLRMEILRIAGWEHGDIIAAVTLPSGWGDSAYIWMNDEFRRLTGENCLKFDSAALHIPSRLDSLKKAKLIFLSGGDQNRMMELIRGTAVKSAIQQAYHNGACIAGTSAGASLMSEKMITGNALLDTEYASTFPELWNHNIALSEGLGLLDSVIIDQHFVVRSRYNRLLSAVIEYPHYQCIGIDESTLLIVHENTARVSGSGQVIVFSPPQQSGAQGELLWARNVGLSIYVKGDTFAIKH